MQINNLNRRVDALEADVAKVNDCPECKDYNSAAYFAGAVAWSGKHYSEIDIPEYRCLTCGKVPMRNEQEMMVDYGKMILDFHAGRPIWEKPSHDQPI